MEALALFRANPENYDLVITDMTMPNLNGDKLAVEMLTIRPGMPIILCTGYSKAISERKAHEIGIKALAMKPITIVDLSQTIRKILDT
jgi:DNA-binding NtrC family response regulator